MNLPFYPSRSTNEKNSTRLVAVAFFSLNIQAVSTPSSATCSSFFFFLFPPHFRYNFSLPSKRRRFAQNFIKSKIKNKKLKKKKMKKNCELCKGLARMHCESDQASLCWTCDFKVHSANFLVARHSRTLLCHVCHSPTPWTATGTNLGRTASVCDNCLRNCRDDEESETEIDFDNRVEERGEIEEDDEDVEEDEEQEEDDEDNQVVPWSPPPPASSSSDGEEEGYNSSSSSSLSSRRGRRENVNTPPETAVEAAASAGGGGRGRVELVDSLSTIGEERVKRRRLESGRVGSSSRCPSRGR